MNSRSDCWATEQYHEILDKVRDKLWVYVQTSAWLRALDLESAVRDFTQLDKRELGYLAAVHFLLSDEANEFIKAVPRILRRMSHSTQQEVVTHRNFIKGRIDWNATLKERCSQGWDPTIFVCRPPSRIYNLPENRLVKFMLDRMKRLIEETAGLRRVEEKDIRLEEIATRKGEPWADRIAWLKFQNNRLLRHIRLRDVDVPEAVDARMMKRANTARNKDYETASSSYQLYNQVTLKKDERTLKELIEERVLEPWDWDKLYEVYILFEIMDALTDKAMKPTIRLVRPGARYVGIYQLGTEQVRVYYQRAAGLFEESKYKEIFEDYELGVALRRPDIVLILEAEDGSSKYWIVEVKRTVKRDYIVDSVYKVLGYLNDFGKSFEDEEQKPKAALVVWDIDRSDGEKLEAKHDVVIVGHREIRRLVDQMLS